ncbi:MAG: SurA N-terminal domain-containing protein, partial [Gammaproteobacteria bacterium]
MLVNIRRNLHKVAATAIIALLVLAFASWGIGDYVSGFSQVRVASVDGKGITDQAFARARQLQEQRYRSELGENYQAGMLDDPTIKIALVQQLIDEHLLTRDARENGYRVSPQHLTRTITGISAFQNEKGFDRDLYRDLLRRQGLSISRFEEDLAESMISDQVRSGLSGSALVTEAELEQLLALQGEQRDIKFLLLERANFADQVTLEPAAIEEFYDQHPERFQTPEQVKIEYLELVLDDFAAAIEIEPELLEKLYSEQAAE